MLNFKFTKEFSVIRKFHNQKASEARLTLPAMCRVEHQKRNQVAAERERASHTKQKIWAKPSKQQSKARKLKYPPEFRWGPDL